MENDERIIQQTFNPFGRMIASNFHLAVSIRAIKSAHARPQLLTSACLVSSMVWLVCVGHDRLHKTKRSAPGFFYGST
jgi:hypothetical protein